MDHENEEVAQAENGARPEDVKHPQFVHVAMAGPSPTSPELVDIILESISQDWFRYGANCWLVCTETTPQVICQKLSDGGINDRFLLVGVIELVGACGVLPPYVWDWIKQDRGSGALKVQPPWESSEPGLVTR